MSRLPDKKRRGDPVLAADWNGLIDALRERTPRPGAGLELVATPAGFTFRVPPRGRSFPVGPGHLNLYVRFYSSLNKTIYYKDHGGSDAQDEVTLLTRDHAQDETFYWRYGVYVGKADASGNPPWFPGSDPAGAENVENAQACYIAPSP